MNNNPSPIINAFSEIVSAYSDKPAICTNERTLSYGQLSDYVDHLSYQIAAAFSHIEKKDKDRNTTMKHPVALLFDNSIDAIATALATLKAGKIYVPFDSTYPWKRLQYMLKHADARLLVTMGRNLELAQRLAAAATTTAGVKILNIETPGTGGKLNDSPVHTVHTVPNPNAYLLYTSGSTGKPKAVLQSQENVLYFIRRYRETLDINPADRLTLFSSFSHDAAIMDIYGALLNGATLYPLHVAKQESLSSVVQWLNREQITIWHSVPTFFRYFLNELATSPKTSFPRLPRLRYIVLGGEAVRSSDIGQFRELFADSGTLLYNLYGQTESSYNGGAFTMPGSGVDKVVLGEPVKGTELLVLDNEGGAVEELEVGEIFVASPHMARGYWNDPETSANVFLYAEGMGRLYRTGDLARIDYDGTLEFMGRKDQQIKIRGYRVETGEIESRLFLFPGIKAAAVKAWEDENDDIYLVAYYVLRDKTGESGESGESGLMTSRLRAFLAGELPNYMVPAYFMELEILPLTPNGKLDRKALPEPQKGKGNLDSECIAPRDELEMKLAGIWAKVLGIAEEMIGIDANFMELGGHSLKAVVLCAEIHKQLHVRLPLPQVFNTPTIRGLAGYIRAAERDIFQAIPQVEKKDYYPVSSAQKRLFILQQMDPSSTHYNMPIFAQLEGNIKIDQIQMSFARLIKRHESLRTSFLILNGVPVQRVHDDVGFKTEILTKVLGGPGTLFQKGSWDFIRPFDLAHAPLLRVGLVKLAEGKYLLLVDIHHIAADGSSQLILARDFIELLSGKDLPGLRLQYRDYAEWQNSWQEKGALKRQEVFWLEQLGGDLPVLRLPTDFQRPMVQSFEGDAVSFDLGQEMTGTLKSLVIQQDVTLYMILLSLLNVMLSKLSGQEDIIIGSPAAGRKHADLQHVIGMLVNTIIIRNFAAGGKSFQGFLKEIKDQALAAFENQDYPFEDLVEKVVVERDISRNPIFDVMFVLQNMDNDSISINADVFSLKLLDYRDNTTRFDLSVTAVEVADDIHFTLAYGTKLFKRETIERWWAYFKSIVSEVLRAPGIKLAQIEMIPLIEKERVLYDFNNTACDFPCEKTAHELFEEQAARTPDRISVNASSQITYHELNEKSNRMAYLLMEKGVQADNIIAIMMERSVEMVIGIMGILKSGGAYLPIDPEYPQERIDYMLKDSAAKLLAVANELEGKKVRRYEGKKVLLESIIHPSDYLPYHHSAFDIPLVPRIQHSKLAYLIYTSGSTGRPKGVMVEHQGIANLMVFFKKAFAIKPDDRILQFANSCFDASVWEIFMSLLPGAALHIVPSKIIAEPALCENYLETRRITVATLPPVYLRYLHPGNINSLRKLITAGSETDEHLVFSWREKVDYINAYGPTESTVCASWWQAPAGVSNLALPTVPIGKPINNTFICILNKEQQLQPVGVPGELHIGGAGVARGYLNNPELTSDRFFWLSATRGTFEKAPLDPPKLLFNYHSPFTTHHSPLYRTGDLARWLSDGNIEFLGRIDSQVKIRGFRIECGEIENFLRKHPGVKEAVVTADESRAGDKYLCAYLVMHAPVDSDFKKYLAGFLPAYMIPTYFIQLEKIPLTPSGKVNHKALPKPETISIDIHHTAQNEIERKLATLWAEILGIEKSTVDIDHNFFHLGGHSLNAAILADKIHKEMNVRVPLVEIFKTPFIRGLAEFIKNAVKEQYRAIAPAEKKEYYALSSMQKRLYVLHRLNPRSTGYNVPLVVVLEGEPDRRQLNETFARLIDRHEILRTSFRVFQDEPVQVIHNPRTCTTTLADVNNLNDFSQPFDLGRAPLLRIGLVRLEQGKYLLRLDMHHIITDGTSMELLVRELLDLYGTKQEEHNDLQYKDFCEWQNRLFETSYLKNQEKFWLEEFSGEIPILNLPLDYPRPAVQDFTGHSLKLSLDKQETGALKTLALKEGVTLYMLLLAVMNILLAKLGGQEDIVIGTPVAGRRHADLKTMIGMFVNTLALRNFPTPGKRFKLFLAEVKEKTIQAFENQEYPFENLVGKVMVNRDTGRSPLFDVMFAFQENGIDGNTLPEEGIEKNGLRIKPFVYEKKTTKFDTNAAAMEIAGELVFVFDYAVKLFKEETVQRFLFYFKKIISTVLDGKDKCLGEIDILSEQEKQQVLVEFNNTTADFPLDKNISLLFEEQVSRTPDHIALVGAGREEKNQISYRQLDQQSDHFAGFLIEKGVTANSIVGILMGRSVEMVIAIMGILKAGGAYLPIDPQYPQERINYMLKDSAAKLVVTTNDIEGEKMRRCPHRGLHHSSFIIHHSKLAYVIYTSGSTGKPKGVMIEQQSLVNYIWWAAKCYVRGERVNFPLFTSISFDLTVTSLFTPLITGNAVVVYGENEELLIEKIITKDKVGVIKLTPSHLKMLRGKIPARESINLKRFILGGENLDRQLALDIHKAFQGKVEILNEYGPTEATVGCMIYKFTSLEGCVGSVPIGLPGDNVQVYILDKHQGPVPTGVSGELHIAGAGIARGYLNNPELTAEKFNFNRSYGSYRTYISFYKTGDLARRLSDGNIEFLGRIDNQVKIRGFRIELGEIEGRLTQRPEVKEAIVLPNQDENSSNGHYLCAYIVPAENGNGGIQVSSLRQYLTGVLPHYMVPSHFVILERIPLTSSGKVDLRILENYKKSRLASQTAYAAPRTNMEKIIAETWQQVLQLEKAGVHDNFFDLGGNSFDIIKINNILKEKLNRDFPVVKAFTYPTIRSLAEYLDKGENSQPQENLETNVMIMTEKMDKGKSRLKERSRRGRDLN